MYAFKITTQIHMCPNRRQTFIRYVCRWSLVVGRCLFLLLFFSLDIFSQSLIKCVSKECRVCDGDLFVFLLSSVLLLLSLRSWVLIAMSDKKSVQSFSM